MNRKDVISTIKSTALLTRRVNASISIINDETKESYEVYMSSTLAVARGVMAWCLSLLEFDDDVDEKNQLNRMLFAIAKSLEADINRRGE